MIVGERFEEINCEIIMIIPVQNLCEIYIRSNNVNYKCYKL